MRTQRIRPYRGADERNRLPSYGITRSQRNYAVIRFPKSHLPLLPFRLRGHTRFVMIGVHNQTKNLWASLVALKTQCVARVDLRLRDSRCRSPRRDREFRLRACKDRGQYPTGNHDFGAQSRSGFGSQPIPFTLTTFRIYASTLNFDLRLISTQQNSILSPWLAVTQAGSTPARLQAISSPQLASHGSPPFMGSGERWDMQKV